MARRKDVDWNNGEETGENRTNSDQATRAVLMDIRDELKQLNRVFGCYRFQGIPNTLKTIDRRLQQAGCLTRRRKNANRKRSKK